MSRLTGVSLSAVITCQTLVKDSQSWLWTKHNCPVVRTGSRACGRWPGHQACPNGCRRSLSMCHYIAPGHAHVHSQSHLMTSPTSPSCSYRYLNKHRPWSWARRRKIKTVCLQRSLTHFLAVGAVQSGDIYWIGLKRWGLWGESPRRSRAAPRYNSK